ncbi:phosphatidylglycerophosphatase B [Posidoniimonas polymericola]|uniref:Phosphatidylglycerophosphatase B n=1 Tax=Posidoniimonas polymericola TaxID=2528002 RepID=A0A5C5ZDF7_9BACT|nr:phosphatase PAP2 family protein [Posidoniimonas polymericola]TWT85362.1 phosphatidylglycerophosphatase B [Posidoniimonas polymericola]
MDFKRLKQRLLSEPAIIGALILASGGVWAFCEIADEVLEGDSHEIDKRLVLAMRNADDLTDPIGPKWFEEMMRDFTALGGVAVVTMAGVTGVVFLWVLDRRQQALLLLAAVVGGFLLSFGMKAAFDRPRPDLTPHGSYVYTRSFPSGHAMAATCIYLSLGAILAELVRPRPLKVFLVVGAILLTVAVGISRVYLGVHWPTDVLAGWAAGGAWALGCWSVARLLHQGKIVIETDEPPEAAPHG